MFCLGEVSLAASGWVNVTDKQLVYPEKPEPKDTAREAWWPKLWCGGGASVGRALDAMCREERTDGLRRVSLGR